MGGRGGQCHNCPPAPSSERLRKDLMAAGCAHRAAKVEDGGREPEVPIRELRPDPPTP